ncbi:hypothetical protein [Aeromicrobium ginsengisoli]|uniref:Uncharacterized protein n=1 Tax=Aeromicrobium ginsengisoli TaxID=363867 RepID=A0A5M4FAT2_9ACTN|nr:hypothetical protein [Aeromicrobium ginsengisoli]KAA1395493.1 hypothetical protein ESP70_015155 [Aeromicrobium ginsengisoli]
MATIHYPLTSVTGHAVHTAGRVAWAVFTRLVAIAAIALAAAAAAGLVDQGPLAGVLPDWTALSVMGSIIVLAVLSIASLGAADHAADAELFDVR